MHLTTLNPVFGDRLAKLQELARKPALPEWKNQAQAVAEKFSGSVASTDELLEVLHEAQRVIQVYEAGLENNTGFLAAYRQARLPYWKDFTSPPVEEKLQHSLGDKLYNIDRVTDPSAILVIDDQSRVVMNYIVTRLMQDGIVFDTDFYDKDFKALLINHTSSEEGIRALGREYVERFTPATTRIVARTNDSNIAPDTHKQEIYDEETAPVSKRIKSGDLYYTLTILPTPADAKKEGIVYKDYVQLFFEMCDQPWERIKAAQEILKGKFDNAQEVHIKNDDGTDLTMSLVDEDGKPFTFCNSVIAKNVPGSEVFSSPRRDSVNGTLVAKGRFLAHHDESKVIENLTFQIEKGRIVSFTADEGAEHFQEYLDRDPNNYYIGELGIGTNPHLRHHVLNGLLVEKIGGSFHFAFGDCYSYKTYEGAPVHLNNGNKTKNGDHWDITTMLFGKGGSIMLDGEEVMKDGLWLDPALAVLNQGWAVVPVPERPEYWQGFQGYGSDGNAIWDRPDLHPAFFAAPAPQ